MEKIISKEELEELMKVKGEVRGMPLKNEAEFIVKEEGEEGLKKLEDTMASLGYPMKYRAIRGMDFYPLGLLSINLLAIKRLFNYDDEKFQAMGRFEAKLSLIIRLFLKYFVSLDKTLREIPKMWKRYYTVGNLTIVEYNEKEKYLIVRIEGLPFHPLYCQINKGFGASIIQMVVGGDVTCEEIKCVHKGDEYHEFLFRFK